MTPLDQIVANAAGISHALGNAVVPHAIRTPEPGRNVQALSAMMDSDGKIVMAKRTRKFGAIFALSFVTLSCAAAYVAAPFLTAWTIREAIRNSDSAYLEHKVEWESVRSTLKVSLASYALTPAGDPEALSAHPGIWQRIKEYFGRGALDRFVDTTVTPTGLSGLLTLRKTYKDGVGTISATAGSAPVEEETRFARMRRVWSRVTRAEFASLSRFELDMLDKDDPARTVNCVLELRGLEWKLTELRVRATARSAQNKFAATRLTSM